MNKEPRLKSNFGPHLLLLLLFILLGVASGCEDRAERLYKRGVTYARQGKFKSAILEMRQLLQINPNNAKAYNALGQIYRAQNLYSPAIEELEKAFALSETDPIAAYNLGSIYREMEKLPLALKFYQEAVNRDEKFAPALYCLGVVYADRGEIAEAKTYYHKFLGAEPDRPEFGYNNLGVILWREGKKKPARKAFQQALQMNPKFPPALFNFGVSMLEREQKEERKKALRALSQYLKVLPRPPDGPYVISLLEKYEVTSPRAKEDISPPEYIKRGLDYESARDYDKAKKQYLRALERDPACLPARYRLGWLYDHYLGDTIKAIEQYEKFLDQDTKLESPLAAKVIACLGEARSRLGNTFITKAMLASPPPTHPLPTPALLIIRITPTPPAGDYYQRGRKSEEAGRLATAQKMYKKAISLDRNHARAYFHLGQVYFKQMKYESARDALLKAQSLDKSLPVRPELAEVYLKMGRQARVASDFERARDYFGAAHRYGSVEEAKKELRGCYKSLYQIYCKRGDYSSAAEQMRKKLELEPEVAADYLILGDLYTQKLGRRVEGRIYYRKFLELAPGDREAPRVRDLLEPRRPEPRITIPPSARGHYNRGSVYFQAGQTEEAEREYRKALELDPEFFPAHYNLGVLYNQRGDIKMALRAYKKAVRLRPDFAPVHLALFKLYYHHFKIKRLARQHAEKYIELEPASPPARLLRKWLKK